MAILNQKRILNLIPKVSAPVTIHVSQGDVGTQIEFTLVKGDEVFVNPGNVTASVHGVREDGANFGPFTCTLSGSKVTFPLHSEMTAVKGSALAEIVLVDNSGNKVGSANFGILVEESVFPLGVTYDNDVSVYESILAYVQTIPAQVTEDYNTKINAEIAARQAADTSLNEALASEESARITAVTNEVNARINADNALGTRIDEIIAPTGGAPSAAEVTDARIDIFNVANASLGDAIRKQFNLAIMPRGTISGSTVDFNTFPIGIRRVYNTTNPQHSPVTNPFGAVITFADTNASPIAKTQLFISYNQYEAYIRYSTTPNGVETWSNWYNFAAGLKATQAYAEMLPKHSTVSGANVNFNNLTKGFYRVFSTTNPQNAPVADPFGLVMVVEEVVGYYTQIFFSYNSQSIYVRYYSNAGWSTWKSVFVPTGEYAHTVTINSGDNLYSILQGISNNTHVIINPGTYDISSAVAATSDTDYDGDIHIKSGCWIEGRGTPTIVCELGTKREYTSVFFMDSGNCKISGVKIVARNTRYGIHDDRANNAANVEFTHVIEDCDISYTGIVGDSNTDGRCIGGGMGANVTSIVRGCIFSDTNYHPINYHTPSVTVGGVSVVAPCKVVIENNYFKNGSVSITALEADEGVNRDIIKISGNAIKTAVDIRQNTANTLVPFVWNNQVVS